MYTVVQWSNMVQLHLWRLVRAQYVPHSMFSLYNAIESIGVVGVRAVRRIGRYFSRNNPPYSIVISHSWDPLSTA
jgi:hypothetical protein